MSKIINDGPIITRVFENSKLSYNQQVSNLENAENIFRKVPNSVNNYSSNVGLVVGKIQSGKTANIIALSGLAFDNDCRLIIMLLSDTTNLLDQNYNRIVDSFEGCDDVLVFKQVSDGDFKSIDDECLNKLYEGNKKIIICSLKHYTHIDDIRNKIKKTGYAKDYTIVIDDEGDDISQNTSKKKYTINLDGEYVEYNRSTNNAALVALKRVFEKCGYISLTATPEAPIFLQKFQELAPNYCVTLQPGIGYTGLTTFHQEDSNLVVQIDDFDCLVRDTGIPNSLIDAVAFYFAGCIYRRKTKMTNPIHSMMIHPAKEIVKHDNVYSKLSTRLKLIERSFAREEESGNDFLALVNEKYKEISKTNENITRDDLKETFNKYRIISINGKAFEKDVAKLSKIFPYNIVIGGDLLDRGITIPNLAVSYIIRDSKKGQVDTLLQRARWFGYKASYIETCKVYMPKSLAEKFTSIIDTEESLWDFLNECSDMEYGLQDCEFSLDIDSSILNPTSGSKASYEFGYSNITSVKQQKTFTINSEKNNENIFLVRSFDWDNAHILEYNEYQKHKYINIDLNTFNSFVDKFNFSNFNEQKDGLTKDLLKNLVNSNISKYGNTVSLIFMRYGEKEERSVYNENSIRNLLQGRSEGKTTDDEDYYPGDRYLPEMKNKISIQIHRVNLKINNSEYYHYGDEVIMLVLCLPKDFAIKNFVKRKNIADADRLY